MSEVTRRQANAGILASIGFPAFLFGRSDPQEGSRRNLQESDMWRASVYSRSEDCGHYRYLLFGAGDPKEKDTFIRVASIIESQIIGEGQEHDKHVYRVEYLGVVSRVFRESFEKFFRQASPIAYVNKGRHGSLPLEEYPLFS